MRITEITRDEWSTMSDEERAEYRSKENVIAREKYAKHQKTYNDKKRQLPVLRSNK